MAVKKLSVALDATVAAQVALAAERAGVSVSAWLNHAAANELSIEAGLDAVREWEADHGELTPEELAAADSLLDRVPRGGGEAVGWSGRCPVGRWGGAVAGGEPLVCSARRGAAVRRRRCLAS